MSFGSFFKSLGQKIVSGVSYVGKKLGDAVSVGVKGLKYVTDKADQYTFGLTSFIPYYGLVKAGIDVADDVVKLARGEEKLDWSTIGRMGLNVGLGLLSKYTGAYEVRALKGAARTFKSAKAAGMGLKESTSLGARALGRAYVPTIGDVKQSFAFARAGGNLARGSVAQKNLVGLAGAIARGADKTGEAVKGAVRAVKTGVKSTETFNQPSGSLANLIR